MKALLDMNSDINFSPSIAKTFNELEALDKIPTTIAYINKNLIYEFVNIKYTEFVKKDKKDIVGRSVYEVVGPNNYKTIENHLKEVLNGNVVQFDCDFSTKDKSEKFASCRYIPNKSEKGELIGFYVYLHDITKQKQYDNLFDYLWKISTDKELKYKDQIERVLYATKVYLEMDHAIITKIKDNLCMVYASSSEQNFFPTDFTFQAQHSFCNTTFEANNRVEYTHCELENPKVYTQVAFQSYIGEPVFVSGEKVGSISFIHKEKKESVFSNRERALVSFIGKWIGSLLSENYERERLIASEKKLSHLSKEYETILDSVPSFIWYKDTKNNILNANKAVLDSLKINREDISGQPSSLYYPDTAEKFLEDDLKVINSKKPSLGIIENFKNDKNENVWVKTDKIPLYNENLEIDRLLVVATDVTTEMESRTRLEHKRVLLEKAYQTTPALMYSINSAGRIELVSDEWLKSFGYSREEVIGRSSTDFLTVASKKDAETSLSKALNSMGEIEVIKERKYDFLTKSGEVREVLISAFPEKTSSGRVERLRAVLFDVTEQNRLDRALRSSNKELEAFAYVASHDLQAPLRHISIFVEILKEELGTDLKSFEAKEALSIVIDGTQKMQNLINDLLVFSKANKHPLRIQEFNLEHALNEVISVFQFEHENLQSCFNFKNLSNIRADKMQISQIFQNLIGNSIKFANNSRPLKIEVEMVDLIDYWEISVKDNGIGFDEKYAEKVFKLFQRLHNDSSYKGTGIGLSICKKVVDRHRGEIKISSQENKGTCFKFTINKYLQNETKNV